jgi:hypothetical protein
MLQSVEVHKAMRTCGRNIFTGLFEVVECVSPKKKSPYSNHECVHNVGVVWLSVAGESAGVALSLISA